MQELFFYVGIALNILLLVIICAITIFFFRKTKTSSKMKGQFDGYLFLIGLFFLILVVSFIIRFYFMFIYPENMIEFEEALIDPLFRYANPDYALLVAFHIALRLHPRI